MEDTDKDQRCRKLSRICELLQAIHSKFQPYSETIKWAERKERMGVKRRTSMSLNELKDKITSQPVLSLPKRKGKFRVETDALGHAIGGVLSQEQEEKWKPIAFLSRTMQPAERNYKIYDKELLTIVDALAK